MRRYLPLLTVLLLAACSSNVRRDWGGGGSDAPVEILRDPGAVRAAIWEGSIVYDLRDYNDWMQGHIPGARRITLDDIERDLALPTDLDAPLLFTGDGPLDTTPDRAAEMAIERGHTRVQIFSGGWRAWTGAHPLRD